LSDLFIKSGYRTRAVAARSGSNPSLPDPVQGIFRTPANRPVGQVGIRH